MGVREVEYRSDDSEASWLIYITIWQHLRREGSSKGTGGWPAGKENKYQGPGRHSNISSLILSDCFLILAAMKLKSMKPKEEKHC